MLSIITLPKTILRGEIIEIRALTQHPMETGFRREINGTLRERDIITTFFAEFKGEKVIEIELSPAIAANPYLAFYLKVESEGELVLHWKNEKVQARENRMLRFN